MSYYERERRKRDIGESVYELFTTPEGWVVLAWIAVCAWAVLR